MKSGNLLLVDDDRLLLESMSQWLREQGFHVHSAGSRQEAIAIAASQPLDLVLSDIRLADGDGFEVLSWCRKNKPELTVILLTGYGSVDTAIDALRAGAFDLLTKPLIDDELLLAIERALSQREVLEENQKLKAQL